MKFPFQAPTMTLVAKDKEEKEMWMKVSCYDNLIFFFNNIHVYEFGVFLQNFFV